MDHTDSTRIDCTDVKALLSGVLDDEIAPEVRHLVERHLVDCTPCRTLIDEAEATQQLLAADLAREARDTALDVDFVGGVLSRTVYAEGHAQRRGQVRSWLGWLVAAAALAFSGTAWLLEQNSATPRRFVPEKPAAVVHHDAASNLKSSVHLPGPPIDHPSTGPAPAASVDPVVLPNVVLSNWPVLDGHAAATTPPGAASPPPLAPEDVHTLHAISDALDLLADARTGTFEDIEMVRRVIEYDDLITRAAALRSRASISSAPLITAVETMIIRLVDGPLEAADVRTMQKIIRSTDLSGQLRRLVVAPQVI